jgi:hypothetical protein
MIAKNGLHTTSTQEIRMYQKNVNLKLQMNIKLRSVHYNATFFTKLIF